MKLKLKRNSPAEEAAIQAGIAADPDAPEWSTDDFAQARPARSAIEPAAYRDLTAQRVRGPQKAPTKELVSLRLDRDLLARLRESGPGWQGRVNATLRKAMLG